jgi:tetratricopeptide (TPR) repeat protein
MGCQRLGCGHRFHEKCVKDMRRHSGFDSCPICRAASPDLTPIERIFDEAALLETRGSYEDAFQKLSEVLEVDPDHANSTRLLAGFYHAGNVVSQDYARAVELYERAIGLGATGNGIKFSLGCVYQSMGKRDQAEAMYLQASDNPDAICALAVMSEEDGNTDRAGQLFWEAHKAGSRKATIDIICLLLKKSPDNHVIEDQGGSSGGGGP